MATFEQQLEQLASNTDNWATNGVPGLSKAVDRLQKRLDDTVRTLQEKWQGAAADLALERLRVMRRNLNLFRNALESSDLQMTGTNSTMCGIGSDNETRRTEADRLLKSLPGTIIPQFVHNALAEQEPFTFWGIQIDLNRGAEQVENLLSGNRENAAREAVAEVDRVVGVLPEKHAQIYRAIQWEELPTADGVPEPVFPPGGPSIPNLPAPASPNLPAPGAVSLPEAPDTGDLRLPGTPGGPVMPVPGDEGDYPYPGGPGYPDYPGNGGTGPAIDSELTTGTLPGGSGLGIGLGGTALGVGGVAARYGSGGGFGLGGGGLFGTGGAGMGASGGPGGAGGRGAGGFGSAGLRGAGGSGGASAAGVRGAGGMLGGAGSGAGGAGAGGGASGGRGMGMVGGMGASGASDKKSRRNGMGYVAPKIDDEGDGGPAAEASRAGRRSDAV